MKTKIKEIKTALSKNFGVEYDAVTHTYTNAEGLELSGITGFIKQYICPDQYTGVAEEVLASARERGEKLHSLLEYYVKIMNEKDAEVPELIVREIVREDAEIIDNYNAMVEALENYTCIASEYVVSNNELTASPIDLIALTEKGELAVIDLKTTYKLNIEFVTWQLNFYRYFLELQTGLKAERMLALHLHKGVAKFVDVEHIDNKHLDYMLYCAYNFEKFENQLQLEQDNLSKLKSIYTKKKALEEQIKALEVEEEAIKAEVIADMQKNAVKTYEGEGIRITLKSAGTKTTFDSKKFAEAEPELYKEYLKVSETKASLIIKIK